jgi:hypothetical protein
MLINTCFECKFHKINSDEETQKSYCSKECCWSVLTNCITQKAMERFLIEECRTTDETLMLGQISETQQMDTITA